MFLKAISVFIGVILDTNTAMPFYLCTLTATNSTTYSFNSFLILTFIKKLAIKVKFY
jgi:hypothetical protein